VATYLSLPYTAANADASPGKIQDTGYFIKQWPNILGCDIAGEIAEVGSNVKNFKKGDRVFAYVLLLPPS